MDYTLVGIVANKQDDCFYATQNFYV